MWKVSQILIGTSFLLLGLFGTAEAQMGQNAGPSAPQRKAKRPQQREAYRAELSHLLETNAIHCEKDDDCDALGVGSMACGGPKEFLPVAKATLAKVQSSVNDLTATIAEMDQTRNKETGTMGICLALTKPKLTCSAGKCEAVK